MSVSGSVLFVVVLGAAVSGAVEEGTEVAPPVGAGAAAAAGPVPLEAGAWGAL